MICVSRITKKQPAVYIGKLQKICFCKPGQAKSLNSNSSKCDFTSQGKQNYWFCLPTIANSQIYDFTCQREQNHWLYLPWRAPKSMILRARTSKIIYVAHLGKRLRQHSEIPHQQQQYNTCPTTGPPTAIKNNDFACPGKQKHRFESLPMCEKSMILFALASKSIDLRDCQCTKNEWFCEPWQPKA